MKKIISCLLLVAAATGLHAQSTPKQDNNTLLWRVSGNGLQKPSYLFGTIHLICTENIVLSDSLRSAISKSDQVYLELDMDNMAELMSVVNKMKMLGDTTLADLLTPEEYSTVKAFFQKQKTMIPFATLEKYKPMLAASSVIEANMSCRNPISMEQLIMRETKSQGKKIHGLETMAFQMSIFDSIPYKAQAKHLLNSIEKFGEGNDKKLYDDLMAAYISQQIDKLGELAVQEDDGMQRFTDILLYRRNETWTARLKELMPAGSLVIAVGAGHLPGNRGVISLLRKAGYTVEPVVNNMLKKYEKQL